MRMRARIRVAAAAAMMVVVAWALPASSQDDAAAAALRQTIEEWLATIGARTGGPIAVRKEGDGLAATLPDVTIDLNPGIVRFGTVTLTRRDVAEGRHRYEGPLPRTIRIEEPQETSTITIGGGSFAVVVDPRTNTAHAYEGSLSNLVLESAAGQDGMSIAAIEIAAEIATRADGLSDSPVRMRVQGVRVDIQSANQGVTVGEMTLTGNLQGFRLAEYERLREASDAAMRSLDMQELARLFEQWLSFAFASMQVDFALADLAYRDGGATPAVTVSRLAIGVGLESLASPRTGARLRYAHDGVAIRDDLAAFMAPYQGFAATAMSIELALAGLPAEEVRDTLINGLVSGTIADESFWTDAFDSLLTAAIDNGATVRLGPFEIVSPLLGISGNATVTGNDRSPLSAVGSGSIVIRGLEDAARAVIGDGQGGGPDSPAAIIAIISAIGQAGTDASGRPTRSYQIEADEQGRLMLNGTDLSALIGGAGGGATPPQPGATPGK